MGDKKVSYKAKLKASTVPAKRVPTAPEPERNFIVWRMGRLDLEGAFSWLRLASGQVERLEKELATFEKMRLDELTRLRWLKLIPTSDLTVKAQRRLKEISDEPEGLWQLHLGYGKWRVWGYYESPMFHIVWWDPDHDACTGKSVNRKAG